MLFNLYIMHRRIYEGKAHSEEKTWWKYPKTAECGQTKVFVWLIIYTAEIVYWYIEV